MQLRETTVIPAKAGIQRGRAAAIIPILTHHSHHSSNRNAIGPVNQWQTGPITILLTTALAISET